MKTRHLAMVLVAACLGIPLLSGCSSSANEEDFTAGSSRGTQQEGTPSFKTQAEYELYRAEQARKNPRKGKTRSAAGSRRR
jgi:hypothetical protein